METKVKTWESFEDMVNQLRKSGTDLLNDLTPDRVDLWHAATGVCTEAGELLDAVKKVVVYNKQMDRENVIEELGDIEFYLQQVRRRLAISREEVIAHNMHKLGVRYSNGYSDKAAQERADKQ